ncbi:MAG: hypothetical protein ACYDBJ_06070 [Aggregatilineales bacterium]
MDIELKKTVQERFAALLAERDQFIASANQKIGEYTGRLAELEVVFKQLTEADDQIKVADSSPEPIGTPKF